MIPAPPVHRFTLMGRDLEFDPGVVSPRDGDQSDPRNVPLRSVALDISGSCNLGCRYCAESATLPPRAPMDAGVLERSLDLVFTAAPEKKAVSIHLGSGEPLLQPSLVRMIGEISRRKEKETGRRVQLYLTTNGTLLTEEILQHLKEYAWNVKISIDGPPAIHDRYRVDKNGRPTAASVLHSLRRLSAELPEMLSTTSVLCHGTDPSGVFYSIAALGVQRIELVPVVLRDNAAMGLTESDLGIYRRFIQDYAGRLARGEALPSHIRFLKRLQKVLGFFNGSTACDAGRSFLAIGPDGTLYPCFRFVGLADYHLGHIDTGISHPGRSAFARGAGRPYQSRECMKCWAAPLCGGPCFAVTELMRGGSPDPVYCSLVHAESEAALWLADMLRAVHPARLLELAGIPPFD